MAKDFILTPLKMASYCVTNNFVSTKQRIVLFEWEDCKKMY